MKSIVSRSPAVGALVITSAIIAGGCASSQLTPQQQAAAQAEDQSQKAQADAQKARDEANKAQKDLADAQHADNEARRAEVAADQKAQTASHQAGVAEQQAAQADRPPAAPPKGAPAQPSKGAAEAQGSHPGHDSSGKVVVITASLLFPTNSSDLLPSSKPKLDEIADALKAQSQASNVKVMGYTDSTGSSEINDPLSEKRAQAVADYLQSKGVSPDHISVQGLGKQDPVSPAQNAEGRAMNRRVDIVISPVEQPGKEAPAAQPPPAQPHP